MITISGVMQMFKLGILRIREAANVKPGGKVILESIYVRFEDGADAMFFPDGSIHFTKVTEVAR
jgi:hypothetical protein